MSPTFRPTACLCVLAALLLGACSTSRQGVFQTEAFGETTTYSRSFAATAIETCEAARRSLLSQGYVITVFRPDAINGRKNFQPNGDVHAEIEFHVTCALRRRRRQGQHCLRQRVAGPLRAEENQ